MNKKIVSGILACALAFGCMLPIAGCKGEGEMLNGGTQNETQNGTQNGGQNQEQNGTQGGEQGGTQGGTQNGAGMGETIAPGTVITDTAVKNEFYDALSKSELNGFTYSASANLGIKTDGSESMRKFSAEGAILLAGEEVKADVYLTFSALEGEETDEGSFLLFLRGSDLYSAAGDEASEFSAMKEKLKAKENALILDKMEVQESYLSLAKSQTVYKIVKNMPALFEGVLEKTEGGYTLSFDVGKSLGDFLMGLRPLAEAFDLNHDLTLGALFGLRPLKDTLETILKGVTAEEFVETFSPILPEEIAEALPEPGKSQAAATYVDGLLRSGSFFKTLTGEDEAFAEWKTFAEVPLKELLGLLTGEEFTFEPTAAEQFDKFVGALKSGLIDKLFAYAGVEEGDLSEEELQFSMTFSFDEEKHLLGFTADAITGGSKTQKTEPAEKSEESGGSETENETETESEAEKQARENAAGGEETGTERKTQLRATVKLEAAGASSPELFDLTGCKYHTEEGGTASVRAKK